MKSLREVLLHCSTFLESRGVVRSRREAEDLLCDALGMTRIALYMEHDRPLTEPELAVCRQRLLRRAKGEPLAYIQGDVEFQDLRLAVTPDVLIPRQETELLVDLVARELGREGPVPGVLWDVCCGSGCIGLALKRRLPDWTVVLSDISEAALAVARRNAERNEVAVTFRCGDLLQAFGLERADVIVCNPPYISKADYAGLSREVRDFEPELALVGGETGLEFYDRLFRELPPYLTANGRVWMEIGEDQGEALMRLFGGAPWRKSAVIRDWSGKERFFSLEIE